LRSGRRRRFYFGAVWPGCALEAGVAGLPGAAIDLPDAWAGGVAVPCRAGIIRSCALRAYASARNCATGSWCFAASSASTVLMAFIRARQSGRNSAIWVFRQAILRPIPGCTALQKCGRSQLQGTLCAALGFGTGVLFCARALAPDKSTRAATPATSFMVNGSVCFPAAAICKFIPTISTQVLDEPEHPRHHKPHFNGAFRRGRRASGPFVNAGHPKI